MQVVQVDLVTQPDGVQRHLADTLDHVGAGDGPLLGEQVRVRPRLVVVLGVVEADRVRRLQPLVGVDVVDRLEGGRSVVTGGADRVVLRVGVVGQRGRVVIVDRCPSQVAGLTGFSRHHPPREAGIGVVVVAQTRVAGQVAVLPARVVLGVIALVVTGAQTRHLVLGVAALAAAVGVAGRVVVVELAVAGAVSGQLVVVPQVVVTLAGVEARLAVAQVVELAGMPELGRHDAAQLGLVEPDFKALTGDLEPGAAPHGLLGDDPARAVFGVNRRHCLSSLKGLLHL